MLVAPANEEVDTTPQETSGEIVALPTCAGHLLSDEDGMYPCDLNKWEKAVLATEAQRTGFRGWYRNPSRSLRTSLAVPWRTATGGWRAMRPDFVFFATVPDGSIVADLVDPHGWHLSDAVPKLCGLADFAEQFGERFRRLESVADVDGKLKVLDFKRADVREAVRAATVAEPLYRSKVARLYV